MESPLVVLVLQEPRASEARALLGAPGLDVAVCAAPEALRLLQERRADVVVLDRQPGWQALATFADTAGAAAVLWGPPPDAAEEGRLLGAPLETAEEEMALVHAVLRAKGKVADRMQLGRMAPLLEQARAAERVGRLAQSISRRLALSEVVGEAVSRVRELCDAEAASLLLVEPTTGELRPQGVSGEGAGLLTVQGAVGQRIASRAAMLAQSVRVSGAGTKVPPAPGLVEGEGAYLAVPLLHMGDVMGVLLAVRCAGRPPFEASHLRWLEELAPHVAIAVQNAHSTARLEAAREEVLAANQSLERKVAERTQMIARAKKEWERTFDAISEPLAVMDGFVIRRANLAYAKKAGLPVTQVPGRRCHEVLAHRDSPCEGCPLVGRDESPQTGEVSFEDNTTHRVKPFWLSEGLAQGAPAETGVVVHYRDVTRQRSLERKLRQNERLAALGQLASGAAHEINNPLGFLISNLKTLDEELDGLQAKLLDAGRPGGASAQGPRLFERMNEVLSDARAIIEESLSGADRVRAIVKALRDLSRQQTSAGAAPTRLEDAASRAIRAEFGEHAPRIAVEVEGAPLVAADPLLLDQALGHVLKNARQAVREPSEVRVRVEVEGEDAVVSVMDHGSGIPEEHLHRIFEPFFTTRGIGKGIGLGLTAAYGIVQGLGGSIEVESKVGMGSRFTLRFPRAATTTVLAPQEETVRRAG